MICNRICRWWGVFFNVPYGVKSKSHAIGWTIEPCFVITLHVKDLELLKAINRFFKVALRGVSLYGSSVARYRVKSREELKVIINHFNEYPLRSSKAISFAYFCEIFNLMGSKLHTNVSGFLKLVSLINKLNRPLSSSTLDKLSYLGVLPNVEFEAPVLNVNVSLDPQWIAGFITGEGSFTYFTRTRQDSKGNTIKDYTLAFEVSQDSKDWFLLNLIKDYFNTGKVYTETRGITKYRLTQRKEIINVPARLLILKIILSKVERLYNFPRTAPITCKARYRCGCGLNRNCKYIGNRGYKN